MKLHVIILAAGQGKRMFSSTPKVLHSLAGKPMLQRVIETAQELVPESIHIIYGHGGERIKNAFALIPVHWIHQAEQLGTGHAVLQALPFIPDDANVLILSADVPLINSNTLQNLIQCKNASISEKSSLTLLVAKLPNPFGLGRIVRENDKVVAIVEEKDATTAQKTINEIYSGICFTTASNLKKWLPLLSNANAQNEYYLTEIISMAVKEHSSIHTFITDDAAEVQGVNNRQQLHDLERIWQQRNACKLQLEGVGISDINRFDVRGNLSCGKDVFIDINCLFEGDVTLADGCVVGPNCVLKNVQLGSNTVVHANTILEGCIVENECEVGPFSRLRPGTHLQSHCKIGNFVETKKAYFGEGSKASHLSYLGDVNLGNKVNVGAGTITCNYDGVNKHLTIIEDGVFIGSDTQLIAPLRIGANATIGAGSTIRKDVPPNELTLTETKQKTIHGWKRPTKKTTSAE